MKEDQKDQKDGDDFASGADTTEQDSEIESKDDTYPPLDGNEDELPPR